MIPCEICGDPMEDRPNERHVCLDCRKGVFDRQYMRINERVIDWGIVRQPYSEMLHW